MQTTWNKLAPYGCVCLIAVVLFAFAAPVQADEEDDVWALVEQDAGGQQFSFSGDFQSRSTMDLVADDEFEDFFTTRQLLYCLGLYRHSDRFSVTLSGIAEHMFRVNSEGHENGARYRADLEEFYTDLHFSRFDLRLGQQLVTWGRTDVIAPTDTINSVNVNYMIDSELGHYKIPNLMAKADYYWTHVNLEAIFIPFFRPAAVNFVGGDWALLGNRIPVSMLTGYLDESQLGRQFLVLLNRQYPGWDEELEETLSSERINVFGPSTPSDDLEHWELATRLGFNFGPVAWSGSYFYAFDDMPTLYFSRDAMDLFTSMAENQTSADLLDRLLRLDPWELFESRYERFHQFGLDFEANLGPSVLRAEGTYIVNRRLYNEELEVVERPMLTYTAAADFVLPLEIDFNLQMFQAYTPYWTDDLLSDRSYTFFVSYLHGGFMEDKLEAYVEILYNASQWSMDRWRKGDIFGEDYQFSGKLSYEIVQDLRLGGGAMVFGGPEDQLLGFARERNFGFLDLIYSF